MLSLRNIIHNFLNREHDVATAVEIHQHIQWQHRSSCTLATVSEVLRKMSVKGELLVVAEHGPRGGNGYASLRGVFCR